MLFDRVVRILMDAKCVYMYWSYWIVLVIWMLTSHLKCVGQRGIEKMVGG